MKKIIMFLLATVCVGGVFAQSSFTASYPISFPMGDLSDYIGQTSFRGVTMEFTKRQKKNLDIGLEFSWHTFYERQDKKVYTEGTASVSGIQYRYTNTMPLLAGVKYYKETDGNFMPFAGLGLGTLYVNRSTDLGMYRITNETWQFALRPELGVTFKAGPGVSAVLGVKYYAGFGTDDLDGQSYISVNLGLMFSNF